MSCTPINQLLTADLIAQLTDAQIQAIIDGRLQQRVVQFTGIGANVYTKPADLLFAFVVVIGAGGGGGAGRRGVTASNRCGGAGGASAGIARRFLSYSAIGPTETVTIGAGGIGGIGQTVDATNGDSGTQGDNTSFGSLVSVIGANGGAGGGTTTSSSGGTVGFIDTLLNPSQFPLCVSGTSGGNGVTTAPAGATVNTGFQNQIGNNGAGGGGVTSAGLASSGASGSRSYNRSFSNNVQATAGNTIGANGGPGLDNWSLQLHFDYVSGVPLNTIGYGTSGGGGGGRNAGASPSNAGTAGLYGAGGSGGGGGVNGFTSGAGSDGAQGCVIVFEYYV